MQQVSSGELNAVFGVFGTGGLGREIMSMVLNERCKFEFSLHPASIVFFEDYPERYQIHDKEVLSVENFFKISAKQHYFVVAIGDGQARGKICNRLRELGGIPYSLFDSTSLVGSNIRIGSGAIISSFVTLTSDISIGNYFLANIGCIVAHDVKIGDSVTLAPKVTILGNVIIESGVSIGAGTTIRNGSPQRPIIIGENCQIGMGSVITKSFPPNSKVFGSPAKIQTR